MSYIDDARDRLIAELPEELGAQEPEIIDLYVVLVFAKGEAVTLADVHDAWAVWRSRTRPDHKDLVPFDRLSLETAEWDRPFVEAIIRTAKEIRS